MTTPIDSSTLSASSLAAQGAAARRLDATLPRLAAASLVKPVQPADGASLSQTNVPDSVRDTAPLRELGARLIDLRRLVANTHASGGAKAAQSKIDETLAVIRKTADAVRGAPGDDSFGFTVPPLPTVIDIAQDVSEISVSAPGLEPGEAVNVEVQVTASAQAGSLKLSFAASSLDLSDPNARFTIEIGGPTGSRELSFSSGTSLWDIADTINSFSGATGLSATVSGTGVRLDTRGFNSDEFVSVKIVDDGDLVGADAGVYRYRESDATTADEATRVGFDQAVGETLTDHGQDLAATINGVQAAVTNDSTVSATLGDLKVSFELSYTRIMTIADFVAFRVIGADGDGSLGRLLQQDSATLQKGESLSLIDDAIRETERAEREALLARAAEGLGIEKEDIPVIREAQAKLIEEARRLGLVAQPDPQGAYDALKP